MDIDLVNDLRRDNDDDNEDQSDDEKQKKNLRDDDDDADENEQSKNADVEKVMKKANEAAKKKVARRPRPKLDVERLIGSRGLEELCHLFKNEKFKGKGHEFADLDTMMHKFEYWAHRLVPHLAFDDFIERAESLGGKKPVKHALQNLRDRLIVSSSINENEEASHALIDLLPTMGIEKDENSSEKISQDNVPNDDELDELFE